LHALKVNNNKRVTTEVNINKTKQKLQFACSGVCGLFDFY